VGRNCSHFLADSEHLVPPASRVLCLFKLGDLEMSIRDVYTSQNAKRNVISPLENYRAFAR
jgi:hypothetical protein